jgi:hypothetical protein
VIQPVTLDEVLARLPDHRGRGDYYVANIMEWIDSLQADRVAVGERGT